MEIRLHNNKFLLAVVYRPPNSGASFWDDLQLNFDLASSNTDCTNFMIAGDLTFVGLFSLVLLREVLDYCEEQNY